jgi:uncharacterized protein YjbI with pentapeptide repeats
MKNKIEIKSFSNDSVLFEYEEEDNTLKDTLIEAVKCGADLNDANLRGADLDAANLSGANLHEAFLYCADLRGADLNGSNLHRADLRVADLRGACLRGADLSGAFLRSADLSGADLSGANLSNASLHNACLRGACLRGAKNIPFIPFACPSDGSFVGWKYISTYSENYSGWYLVKLRIPADARRCSATTNKCRCDKAEVLEITNIETNEKVDVITNTNKVRCVYRVGEMVYPDDFDEDRWNECSHGIHFFINKQDAIDY